MRWGRNLLERLRATSTAALHWILPPVEDEIRPALNRAQFASLNQQSPILICVAALNTVILMLAFWQGGQPLANYGWMALLLPYCLIRLIMVQRRSVVTVDEAKLPDLLRRHIRFMLGTVTALSLIATGTFVADIFSGSILVPISLAFGSTAIAHSFFTVRQTALGAVFIGMVPSSIAMLFTGDVTAQLMAASILSVAFVMLRFVAHQNSQFLDGLRMERQIRLLADTDALTGIANRRAMMAAIEDTYAACAENAGRFGVALIDLDGFKQVNDTMGHHAGDAMLATVASRLRRATGPSDMVGRLGGDEFIILYRDAKGHQDLSQRSDHMLIALCAAMQIDQAQVPVGASLGYALFPDDGSDIPTLLQIADAALYATKRSNKAKQAASEPALTLSV